MSKTRSTGSTHVLEASGGVVDHLVGAELARPGDVVGAGHRADHVGAAPARELGGGRPTPPVAPWISTRWPASSAPWSNRDCQAVRPGIGSAAASG